MEGLLKICKKYSLFLIEDAAEAFGSKYQDKYVGTFGDIATFSFFGNKTMTTGEGGMVVSNNKKLIEKCAYLKSQAVSLTREYWHDELGFNYRMTNLCAAIGVAQLERADDTLLKKRKLVEWYKNDIANCPVTFQVDEKYSLNSFWMVSIIVNDPSCRDDLRIFLKEKGIETRPFFPLMHKLPIYSKNETLQTAEMLEKSGLNLPSFPLISREEVSYISDSIKIFFKVSQ
jgi:perosamine synthetase